MFKGMRSLLLCLIVLLQSGCFLAPTIDSFKKVGFSEEDRKALLPNAVKTFSDARHWGEPGEAMRMAAEKNREQIKNLIRKEKKEQKIVEGKVDFVDFSENGTKAEVDVMVRYYKVPYFVVTDRMEKQIWEFSLTDGWQIVSIEFNEN